MKTNTHFWSYLTQFFVEWEMFQTKDVGKIKTHILRSVAFFEERAVCGDNVEECCRAGEAIDDNMAHAHMTLGT